MICFKALYPDVSILPKMHYMVHYPSQVYRFGPLVNTWTMRYEAKLSGASRHRNFKNICYTVTKRHQHMLYRKVAFDKGNDIWKVFARDSDYRL